MKSLFVFTAFLVLAQLESAPIAIGPSAIADDRSWEAVHPIFPSFADSQVFWREAVPLFDTYFPSDSVRIECGEVSSLYGPPVLAIRVEKRSRTIKEAYYAVRVKEVPTLKDEKDRVVVVMPSGLVLLEWKRTPAECRLLAHPSRHRPALQVGDIREKIRMNVSTSTSR